MSVKIDKGSATSALNMTPMIDVVFNLLIFFLVATRFEEVEREMSVVLPQASEARPMTEKPKDLMVNVTRTGKIVVNGQALNSTQLLTVLRQSAANNPGRAHAVIRGDQTCELRYITDVINRCNQAGVRHSLATDGNPDS